MVSVRQTKQRARERDGERGGERGRERLHVEANTDSLYNVPNRYRRGVNMAKAHTLL